MISGLFNRVQNPARFFRFRKTALALAALSWAPFLGGIYMGAQAVTHDPPASSHTTVMEPASDAPARFGLSFAMVAGSYILGYGATAYYMAGRHYARRTPAPV